MVRLNLSLTRREFCATVAGAITESCEKSTVTIQRADLRHPFFSLSSPPLFLSPRPFTSRFPVYRRHVTSGQGWWKKRGDAFIDSVYRFNFTSSFEPSSDKKAKVQVYVCMYMDVFVEIHRVKFVGWMCVYRTGRIVARSFKVFGLRKFINRVNNW